MPAGWGSRYRLFHVGSILIRQTVSEDKERGYGWQTRLYILVDPVLY